MPIRRHGVDTNAIWKSYVQVWNRCTCCLLGPLATNRVLARGTLPCDVLFIGEAPGKDEDATGEPFVGRAGCLLDEILTASQYLQSPPEESRPGVSQGLSWAICNTVVCAPWVIEMPLVVDATKRSLRQTLRPPSKEEIGLCAKHVIDLIFLAAPQLIVTLGKVAEDSLPLYEPAIKGWAVSTGSTQQVDVPVISLLHPAYILRQGGTTSIHFTKLLAKLDAALRDLTPLPR